MNFAYDHALIERYPTIHAGAIHTTGIANGNSQPTLLEEYRAEQRAAAGRMEATAISDIPSISAWRRVFTAFGAKPTRHRNAAESLLRRLAKHGDIPSINTLVDIGNLASIRYAMPVAVFDLADIATPITVRFATGAELFTDLGSTESAHPDPGEVIFVDEENVVCARRWCWRQSAGSATGPTTTEALIIVEAHHETAERDTGSALEDLAALLAAHKPEARVETCKLSPANPRI